MQKTLKSLQVDDAKRRHLLSHNPLDCDHKLLSSSPQAQTSMHSQVRRRARSSKGRLHVSFSEDSPSDFPHSEKERGRKLDLLDFGRGVSPTRRLNLNDTGKLNSHELARDLKLGSYECQCLASSTAHKELHKRLADDRKAADSGRNYSSKDAKEALAATWSSCGDFRGQYLQTGSDPESSLKHSSDAKLNSCFCPLSNSTFTSLGDFQSKCRSLLDEKPLEDSQPVSAPLSVARKGQESSVSRSLSPSRVEFKHSRSPTHCSKETNKEASALFRAVEQIGGQWNVSSWLFHIMTCLWAGN
ncbi:uncharacterized protein LOC132582278 [Heteronotia binoei]|uniref:uncharacterized protein LOC132582278 n=1 Tax=Heteronotia binoei TaxID=13085 RepID=UPI002931DF28|nr:uncharacterized protein LOC132582278 [Heteronotia binoei]